MSTELAELRSMVEELRDREAIRDVITGIARGVDRFDQKLLATYVHPEASLDMGGPSAVTGAAFVDMLKSPAQAPKGRMHVVSNQRIVLNGAEAWSESHVLSCQTIMVGEEEQTRIRAGRYLDRFTKHDGAWKLVARTFVDEWGRVDALKDAAPQGAHRGAPAPEDQLYRLFGAEASR
jgi:SnoaL-like domain